MAGIRVLIASKGYEKIANKLGVMAAAAKNPSTPMKQCAIWLFAQTVNAFSSGGAPEKWAPISDMTKFIRLHRASPKFIGGDVGMPGSDTGRLKGSFLPVVAEDGTMFGVSTNVEYAEAFQKGGPSEDRDVDIMSFVRKYNSGKSGRVKAYTMHVKGSSYSPRPFFPEGMDQLSSWGYTDKLREIFRLYFQGLKDGGTA